MKIKEPREVLGLWEHMEKGVARSVPEPWRTIRDDFSEGDKDPGKIHADLQINVSLPATKRQKGYGREGAINPYRG